MPPEARERIQRFVELHRSAAAELDTVAPDVFIGRLIERLGVRGRPLLAPEDAAEQRASLERLHGLAVDFVRATPSASTRDLARHLATVVPDAHRGGSRADRSPAPLREPPQAGDTAGDGEHAYADLDDQDPAGEIQATFQLLREEVLDGVARIGGRLGELRLDTDLDISHGVVRYLELLKLSALLQRPEGQSLADALADVNARLLAATTPLQREIFQTSTLDETLSGDRRGRRRGRRPRPCAGDRAARGALARSVPAAQGNRPGAVGLGHPDLPQLSAALQVRARPAHPHRADRPPALRHRRPSGARALPLRRRSDARADAGPARRRLAHGPASARASAIASCCEKARAALTRYHARLHGQDSQPVWFERQFDFRLGPHHLRGRVDRVDRLAGGSDAEYELIDYKTSRPKTAEQLRDDVQLSLYALAAREDWQLESSRQAYYYVLDDLKVPVPRSQQDAESVKDVVLEVGEGILAQEFEPTPSRAACSICDYRIVCPAAEA